MNPIRKLSLTNYTAIAFLERLGLSDPNLEQIAITETMISIATYPQEIEPETIRQCVGNNSPAYYFLFVKANERCKVKMDEEIRGDLDEEEVEL